MPRRLVGLTIQGRIARPHSAILHNGEKVGEVTSGTRSPSTGVNIAMGYVPSALAKAGTALVVDVRGAAAEATVQTSPFYTRPY